MDEQRIREIVREELVKVLPQFAENIRKSIGADFARSLALRRAVRSSASEGELGRPGIEQTLLAALWESVSRIVGPRKLSMEELLLNAQKAVQQPGESLHLSQFASILGLLQWQIRQIQELIQANTESLFKTGSIASNREDEHKKHLLESLAFSIEVIEFALDTVFRHRRLLS